MADEPHIVETVQQGPEINPAVGVANGAPVLDANGQDTGEKVVYEFDQDGQFSGWHKEQA